MVTRYTVDRTQARASATSRPAARPMCRRTSMTRSCEGAGRPSAAKFCCPLRTETCRMGGDDNEDVRDGLVLGR